MKRSLLKGVFRGLVFYAIPLSTACLAAAMVYSPSAARDLVGRPVFQVFLVLTVAVSGIAAATRAWLNISRARSAMLRKELVSSVALRRSREADLKTLRREVELLSAIREIGVIVNADDEFKDVISKVLEVVAGAMKASDLVLYLVDRDSRGIEPAARRIRGETTFKRKLSGPPTLPGRVTEALEHRMMMKDFDGGVPVLTLPLVVAGEAVGALKATLQIDEEGENAVAQIGHCENFLKGLERHLALAIKAPSLYHRAVVDALTGLFSRRHFENQIAGYFKISKRRATPLGFIICDIDHFKKVNDTFGHQTGDIVLNQVARIIQKEIREYDSAYRYGGEEMCVILPHTEMDDSFAIAERIRARVESKPFKSDRGDKVPVTLSLGVGAFAPWMELPGDLVARADQALYRAKDGGRNRTEKARTSLEGPRAADPGNPDSTAAAKTGRTERRSTRKRPAGPGGAGAEERA